jgi:hypothetical protein
MNMRESGGKKQSWLNFNGMNWNVPRETDGNQEQSARMTIS